jgi:dynein heavy chain
MEDESIEYQQRCRGLDKEVKDWQVFKFLKNDVDKFKLTMPLIFALKQDFMRERHWKELRFEVKDDFDETADEFTLEKALALNLLQHEEKILELTDNAFKQLKIEKELNVIDETWTHDPKSNLNIDKKNSKADNEEFYMIASTENIMELIEDHGGKLGNMKSSPYYKEFDTKIDLWEGNISAITETLEILLAVQGKWKYLESIFRGQPDISK